MSQEREQGRTARPVRRRAKRRHPRRILGIWARLSIFLLAVIVLGVATVGLIAKAIRPYRESSDQSVQLADTNRQIASLNAQNNALRQRISYLKTTDGVTTEARKLGYIRPGEIPIVVEAAAPTAASSNDDSGVWGRARRFFGNFGHHSQ